MTSPRFVLPETIVVNEQVQLELINMRHAAALMKLIDKQRPYLSVWLPWVDNMLQLKDAEQYISGCKTRQNAGNEYGYVIRVNGQMAGRIGVYKINSFNQHAEIGYWLDESLQGRGIMTAACTSIVQQCFTQPGLHRLEIRCAEKNEKSAAIPLRLGFSYEGLLRDAEKLPSGFVSLKVFGLLRSNFQ